MCLAQALVISYAFANPPPEGAIAVPKRKPARRKK
jgi:hypothetical protein